MVSPGSAADAAPSFDSFFSPRRFATLLALLVGVGFFPVLTGFQSFVARDFGLFGHPLASYLKESFWRGEIPLWNPLNNCGMPFAAQWNTMVFYPPSLFYVALPLPWSLCVFCLLHLYFGGLGMYFLAHRWTGSRFAAAFAGIVFAFNGLALHCLMWPNNSSALAWSPWILLLVERACCKGGWAVLPAIVAGACQFLAGAPEAFLLTWVAAAALWLQRVVTVREEIGRSLLRFVAVVLGVVVASAVQLLPLLELISHSQRTADYDTGGWAMPATGWANFLVPLFRTITSESGLVFQVGQAWTSSYYFGVITLWLAFLALCCVRSSRVWTLWLLVLIGALLALGNAGYLWPWVKNHVGALGFMRYPVKLVFLIAPALTLLGAYGMATFLRTPASKQRRVTAISVALLSLLLIGIAAIVWGARAYPMAGDDWMRTRTNGLVRACFLVVLVVALLMLRKSTGPRAPWSGAIWLALVAADLFTHMPWQNPTVPSDLLAPRLEALNDVRRTSPPGLARTMLSLPAIGSFHQTLRTNVANEYLARRLGLSHNLNLLEAIPKPEGFFSLYLSEQQDVQLRLFRDEEQLREPLADTMAIALMTAPGKLFEWRARTNFLPMISAGQQPIFVEETEALETMLKPGFDPRTSTVLSLAARPAVTATRQPTATAAVQKFSAHEIAIRVSAPGTALVSVSQSFYPAWRAYVDGAPTQLWRANRAFVAVQVPDGEHTVLLKYEDRMFRAGAGVSGLVVLALVIAGSTSGACRRAFLCWKESAPDCAAAGISSGVH